MKSNYTIAIAERNVLDGCGFYRTHGPLKLMADKYPITIKRLPESFDTIDLFYCDVLLIGRPTEPGHLELIKAAHSMGCKVWLDYDDDFFNVPEWNPHSQVITEEVLETVAACCAAADLITVSTDACKLSFTLHTEAKRIEVVKNAIRIPDNWAPKPIKRDKTVIAWRGTNTHAGDIAEYHVEWKSLALDPTVELHLFGLKKEQAPDWLKGAVFHPFQPMLQYMADLIETAPDFLLYPLKDHPFNHAKSNIAWMEATVAGAAVYTNFRGKEWDHQGITLGEMGNYHPVIRHHKLSASRQEIENWYDIDFWNEFRWQHIRNLVGRPVQTRLNVE